jgi:hypothetical protein
VPDHTYRGWSREKLEQEEARLAKERTAIREAQNAVTAELEIHRALDFMNEETRRIVQVRLDGKVAPAGAAKEKRP